MNLYIALGSAPAKTINEAALVPEVRGALTRWLTNQPKADRGVLIGGLALSFYARPRQTMDVDLLFAEHLPTVNDKFKRHRDHAALDKKDHVELEFVTPALIKIPPAVAKRVIDTAWDVGGMQIASLDSMIVLKLYGADNKRRQRQDEADIQSMLEHNKVNITDLVNSWRLEPMHAERLRQIALDVYGEQEALR